MPGFPPQHGFDNSLCDRYITILKDVGVGIFKFADDTTTNRVSQMGRLVEGDNLGKMSKNCMEITKSAFLGQNNGGWDKPIFRVVGGGILEKSLEKNSILAIRWYVGLKIII